MRHLLSSVLVVTALLVVAGPTAAAPNERVGERINLRFDTPARFAAGEPFHVVHGWGLSPDSTEYDAIGKFEFRLELDGQPLRSSFVERTKDGGLLSRFWVYNFPDGLPAGVHVLSGSWVGPCQPLVDAGALAGPCERATDVVAATGSPLMRTIRFTSGTPDPRVGGTAVVGADSEPSCLNVLLARCNFPWTSWTAGVALPGAFRVTPTFAYEPMLVDRVDVAREPFTLTYHIRREATWSDGTTVSARDFLFTLRTVLDTAVPTRAGYDSISDAFAIDEKTVRFVFTRPFAAWRTLFPSILPEHVLAGRDFNAVWDAEIADPATHQPIGSGPFLVTGWTHGTALTLSRNPRWWGPHEPFLDSIVVRFILDTNQRFQAFRAGALDVLAPQAQLQIADLLVTPGVTVESGPGTAVDHLDFNTDPAGMPLLRERWFRQAVAYAIDRPALVPLLYGVLGASFGAQQSLVYPTGHEDYAASFGRYAYAPTTVASIMQDHGCAKGADGIWVCGNIRASVKFATTTGNPVRDLAQQRIQNDARAAGIELVADNSSSGVLFGIRLPARDYESMMFAWVLATDPGGLGARYGCGGAQNDLAYCSPAATALFEAAEAEVDPGARAGVLHDAEAILAADVPSLPLFARPDFLAYWTHLHGAQRNPSEEGPTWNVEEWWRGS